MVEISSRGNGTETEAIHYKGPYHRENRYRRSCKKTPGTRDVRNECECHSECEKWGL